MKKFVKQLTYMGYEDITLLKVNAYRKERMYFSAISPDGDKVFLKLLVKEAELEKREIIFEKQIGLILGEKQYQLPEKYKETCVVSRFIESLGDIKWAIKKGCVDEAIHYIRSSIENYTELLERLNQKMVECPQYGYSKMVDIYSKRWAYYSKKSKLRKQMAYYVFVFHARLKRLVNYRKITPVKYVILGDLNPGNCLCLPDKTVKCIDYEKVCFADPNVDMASYIVKIRHHARNNTGILKGIDEAVNLFKKTKYYNENNYKFAFEVFDYIDKNWS